MRLMSLCHLARAFILQNKKLAKYTLKASGSYVYIYDIYILIYIYAHIDINIHIHIATTVLWEFGCVAGRTRALEHWIWF